MTFYTIFTSEFLKHFDGLLFLKHFKRTHPLEEILIFSKGDHTDISKEYPLQKVIPLDNAHMFSPEILAGLPQGKVCYIAPQVLFLNAIPLNDITQPNKLTCCEDTLLNSCRVRYRKALGTLANPVGSPFSPLSYYFFAWDNDCPPPMLRSLKDVHLSEDSFSRSLLHYQDSLNVLVTPPVAVAPLVITGTSSYWSLLDRITNISPSSMGVVVRHVKDDWGEWDGSPEVVPALYKSFTSKFFPDLLPNTPRDYQVIVISRNQREYIHEMVSRLQKQLPNVPIHFVLDRSTDDSLDLLRDLNIPFITRGGDHTPFRAGSSRSEGIKAFGCRDTLFLDGDRLPFNLSVDTLDSCLKRFDLACMRFIGGSEHRFFDVFSTGFSENNLLAPYIFQEDLRNRMYSNGFLMSKEAIQSVMDLQGGNLFFKAFDGKHGDEDVFLGTITSLLGKSVGFFPYEVGTGGPPSKGALFPTVLPDNRELSLSIYDSIKGLDLNTKLSSYVPFQDRMESLKKLLVNISPIGSSVVSIERSLSVTLPLISGGSLSSILDSSYVFLVFTYNFKDRLVRCLKSIEEAAKGHNASVIVYDDGSQDHIEAVRFLEASNMPYVVFHNLKNMKKAHNLYTLAKLAPSLKAPIIFVDGDDYLNNSIDTIGILKEAYSDPLVDSTLGSFQLHNSPGQKSHVQEVLSMPKRMDFRHVWDPDSCWCWFHLKTIKAQVLFRIEDEFFTELDNQTFVQRGDDNLVLPRAYQLSRKVQVIDEPLYVYDTSNSHEHIDDVQRYNYIMEILLFKKYVSTQPSRYIPKGLSPWRQESGKPYKDFWKPVLNANLAKRFSQK